MVILTYHRVFDARSDPERLTVTPERFDEHVAAFSARYELLSVGDTLRMLAEGHRLPRRGLAITLDDGYADALTHAYPILRAHDAPATVFVSTAGLSTAQEFWWDELERLVLRTPLPSELHLRGTDGIAQTVRISPEDREVPSVDVSPRFEEWDVTEPPQTARQRLYLDLSQKLRSHPTTTREELLRELRNQLEASPAAGSDKRSLTGPEVAELASDGLVEIGAHTVNHPWLAALTSDQQREEIVAGKRALETLTGGGIVSFSYPYGSAGSFTSETKRLVREAGFLGAVTTELETSLPWGSASIGSDRFALARTPTGNVPAEQLIAVIDKRLGL